MTTVFCGKKKSKYADTEVDERVALLRETLDSGDKTWLILSAQAEGAGLGSGQDCAGTSSSICLEKKMWKMKEILSVCELHGYIQQFY